MGAIQKVELGFLVPADVTEAEHRALCVEVAGCHEKAQRALEICQFQIGDLFNSIPRADRKAYCEEVWGGVFAHNYVQACGAVSKAARLKTAPEQFLDTNAKTGEPISVTSVRSSKIPFSLYREANRGTTQEQFEELIKWAIHGIERPPATPRRTPTKREMIEYRDQMTGKADKPKITITPKTEIDAAIATLPKSVSTAARKVIDKIIKILLADYQRDLEKALAERVKPEQERLNKAFQKAEEKRKRYEGATQSLNQIMTPNELKLVMNCLHPDKHPGQENKYQQAFEVAARLRPGVNA